MVRLGVVASGLALGAFHATLFADQIARGALSDPARALRWVVAGGLVGAICELHRRGVSLAGRRGVAVWVVAALLHGPALATSTLDVQPVLPEAIASMLQIGLATVGIGLCLVAALRVQRPGQLAGLGVRVLLVPAVHVERRDLAAPCAPRPPPSV